MCSPCFLLLGAREWVEPLRGSCVEETVGKEEVGAGWGQGVPAPLHLL